MFCARDFSFLPFGDADFEPVRKILGILAYSSSFLEKYGHLQRTPLETAQAIDQSRVLEHDFVLHAVEFSKGYPGINEPREVPLVESYLLEDPRQQKVLARILN
jgi:CMP-2-keto-3-deoxyoctulosonic acid synthetase